MELREIRQALKNETDNPYQFGVFCDVIMKIVYLDVLWEGLRNDRKKMGNMDMPGFGSGDTWRLLACL